MFGNREKCLARRRPLFKVCSYGQFLHRQINMPSAVLVWVWFCAYLNCAGWALSALHELNAGGYAVALALWLAGLFVFRKSCPRPSTLDFRRLSRRFRRPFPLAFLILAALAFLGGVLHAPNNYDALAYRVPRVLHWLDAGQWHWIHTIFPRVNTRACGIEWVSAPLIALTKTDRLLFLINTVSFLLLPGLVFSVFTRLGVRRRVAWHWMWILPTGYGFLLQAGSIANDLFAAPFVLAAVDFALRAKVSNSRLDFFTSIVAAGMMTACKLSNLTLLLPWALAMLPSAKLAFRWPARTAAVCALALAASVLPTAFENYKHTGDWTGMAAEQPGMPKMPFFKMSINAGLFVLQNIVPPVFPMAEQWNRAMDEKLPPELLARLDRTMEGPVCRFHLEQMQIEENAGLGFGVSVLLLASVVVAFFKNGRSPGGPLWMAAVRWSPLISLLVLFAQSNLYPVARYLTSSYGLLLLPLLAPAGHEWLVRKRWWRIAAFAVFLLAVVPLILSPARPLFPVQTILAKIKHLPERIETVYSIYRDRNDAFAPARDALPPDLRLLGMVTFDDPETSLWHPFGSRRVIHVCPGDTVSDLKAEGVEYILVKPRLLPSYFHLASDDWLKRMNAEIVLSIPLRLRAGTGVEDWQLVRLR
jgi:hypothetical protein